MPKLYWREEILLQQDIPSFGVGGGGGGESRPPCHAKISCRYSVDLRSGEHLWHYFHLSTQFTPLTTLGVPLIFHMSVSCSFFINIILYIIYIYVYLFIWLPLLSKGMHKWGTIQAKVDQEEAFKNVLQYSGPYSTGPECHKAVGVWGNTSEHRKWLFLFFFFGQWERETEHIRWVRTLRRCGFSNHFWRQRGILLLELS